MTWRRATNTSQGVRVPPQLPPSAAPRAASERGPSPLLPCQPRHPHPAATTNESWLVSSYLRCQFVAVNSLSR